MNANQIAVKAIAKCAAYDPWFPAPQEAMIHAWGELIERHDIGVELALEAVTKMYDEHGSGFKPLPKDFIDAARAIRRVHSDSETDAERDARALRNDERLGLDTSWYRGDSRTNDALAAERRAAIQAFTHGMAAKAIMAGPEDEAELVATYGKSSEEMAEEDERGYDVASIVRRQRASAPPVWGDPAREPLNVDQQPAQPQDDPTPCPRCHYPDGHELHVCHGVDYRIGPTD